MKLLTTMMALLAVALTADAAQYYVRTQSSVTGFVTSLVSSLSCSVSPSDIPGFVVPVGIDAVYGKSFRASPDMFEKCREIFEPKVAHDNASRSVVLEIFVSRVVATGLDGAPTRVFTGDTPSRSLLVCCDSFDEGFSFQTSAAFCDSFSNVTSLNEPYGSAVAFTPPCILTCGWEFFVRSGNDPSSKTLTR